jgi:hypothetical protein
MHSLAVDRAYGVDHCDVTLVAGIIAGFFDQIAGRTLFGESVSGLSLGRDPIFLTQAAIKPSP